MPINKTEGQWQAEFIVSEGNGKISRDAGVLTAAAAAKIVAGTVVGKVTATGKYAILAPGASDGTQNAAGILISEAADNTLGGAPADFKVTVLTRLAEYNSAEIVWPGGITGGQQTAAIAQLVALYLIGRATD